MKITISLTIVVAFLTPITVSCKKNDSQNAINTNQIKAQLNQTEGLLLTNYNIAALNAHSLATQVAPNGHYTNPLVMMEDSLYRMNDSLFNVHYLTYCKELTDDDSMMGNNNMMGGNTMHGSNMMANHTFMGDTAKVNHWCRDLNVIRQAYHHPVK